ncbi:MULTISPECIES: hypothetical protein [Pseudomonas]|uniref:hypothetical protein n=1 Tax=Pseudomonas nitroreducens TaxID=46680 RepID=UPI001E46CB2B|nr:MULTISPECIES: hypothetical protein [Pseudomonas]MCE4073569.1 hypothetical protein [Pseudomonas nitritireducens]MCE4082769.1 hypothetical protein [Pseudomonas nitroreducens]
MDDFIKSLEHRVKGCAKRNRRNYYAAFFLLAASVLFSVGTAIAVAVDSLPKAVVASLASIPGVFILINTTFRFEERSRWYWRKRTKLESILRRLKFEGLEVAEASKLWNQIDESMFEEWPGFGAGPAAQKINEEYKN